MAFLGGRRWRTLTATLRRPVEGRLADGVELGVGQFDLEGGEIFPHVLK
jgi:hypothetical protein